MMLAYGSTAVAAAVAQRCAGCLSIVARKSCRTIASSAAASGVRQDNAPLVHLEQGSALKEVEQLDRRAQNLYREHPLAFHNFPVENLEWRATTNMLGAIVPDLFLNGSDIPSFTHLTPWAVTLSSTVGMRGNMGRTSKFRLKPVEANEAYQELTIGGGALIPGRPLNQAFQDYVSWLTALEDKLVVHLAENLEHYPALKAEIVRVGSTDITADLERMLIRSMRGKGDHPGNERIFFRSRLYIPPRTNVNWSTLQYACWLDKEVGEKHKLIRLDVPMFDNNGKLLELAERRLDFMDVVAVQTKLNGNVFTSRAGKVHVGLVRNLASVVQLRPGLYSSSALRRQNEFVQNISQLRGQ